MVFINELSSLCEYVGADAREVEQGLKSEMRIGSRAYLRPGNAFAGGTLARDVNFLKNISKQHHFDTQLFPAILTSNQLHKQWLQRRLTHLFGNIQGKTFAVLGLTYKAGTDTLRRSTSIETCYWLQQMGAKIKAFDPVVKQLPDELAQFIDLQTSSLAALTDADAAVIATEWPDFTALTANDFLSHMTAPYIFDANGYLSKSLSNNSDLHYFIVGSSTCN